MFSFSTSPTASPSTPTGATLVPVVPGAPPRKRLLDRTFSSDSEDGEFVPSSTFSDADPFESPVTTVARRVDMELGAPDFTPAEAAPRCARELFPAESHALTLPEDFFGERRTELVERVHRHVGSALRSSREVSFLEDGRDRFCLVCNVSEVRSADGSTRYDVFYRCPMISPEVAVDECKAYLRLAVGITQHGRDAFRVVLCGTTSEEPKRISFSIEVV